jgi:hypothetical protein
LFRLGLVFPQPASIVPEEYKEVMKKLCEFDVDCSGHYCGAIAARVPQEAYLVPFHKTN